MEIQFLVDLFSIVNIFLTTWLIACAALLFGGHVMAAVQYVTRTDAVVWEVESSKFMCSLTHPIDGFGDAVFERQAGRATQFHLKSSMARMKTGKALLVVRPPPWSPQKTSNQLGTVNVRESRQPITVGRKLSERMLSELQRGLLIDFQRQALYGGNQPIRVTVSSIGFRESYQEYLNCQASLLAVNYKQIERSTLNYDNEDEDLKSSAKRRLDTLVSYVGEDSSIKSIYIDGHTDSEGIRGENLLKSQLRAERVFDYLVEKGLDPKMIAMRWHGERYPLQANKTNKGKAKNRRVTVRLSKEPPQFLTNQNSIQASLMQKEEEAKIANQEAIKAIEDETDSAGEKILKDDIATNSTLDSGLDSGIDGGSENASKETIVK